MKTAFLAFLFFGLGVASAAPVTTQVQARLADASGAPLEGVTEFEVRCPPGVKTLTAAEIGQVEQECRMSCV